MQTLAETDFYSDVQYYYIKNTIIMRSNVCRMHHEDRSMKQD